MTREQKLKFIAADKTILKARRSQKLKVWEIVYYNGTSYNTYDWMQFYTRELCIDKIVAMLIDMPKNYVSEDLMDWQTRESFDMQKQLGR